MSDLEKAASIAEGALRSYRVKRIVNYMGSCFPSVHTDRMRFVENELLDYRDALRAEHIFTRKRIEDLEGAVETAMDCIATDHLATAQEVLKEVLAATKTGKGLHA